VAVEAVERDISRERKQKKEKAAEREIRRKRKQ
jgi:hypothetical protein